MEIVSPKASKSISLKRNSQSPIVLICPKHQNRLIDKICIEPSCKFEILICSECFEDSQMHVCLHRDSIISFEEFITTCKSLSLNHKFSDGTGISDKENKLLLDLDKLIVGYKNHLKREEDKIEKDFDDLISRFKKDMAEIKSKIKDKLYENLGVLVSRASSLREAAREIQTEKISNLQINNEFDTFIDSLNTASNGKKPYSIKKMVTEVMRVLNNTNSLKNRSLKVLSNNTSIMNSSMNKSIASLQKSEILANFTSLNQKSENLVNEVYHILDNKPFYKNKGDAEKCYTECISSMKNINFELQKNSENFIKFSNASNDKSTFPTFSKKMKSNSDLNIVQIDKPKALDNIKKISTSHTKGINCLVVCNESLITGSLDRTIKAYDIENFSEKGAVQVSSDVISLAKVPKRDVVLAGCYKEFYSLTENLQVLNIYESEHLGTVNCLRAFKDGITTVTNAKDGKLLFWNLDTKAIVKKTFDHRDVVYTLDVQDTKGILVSGGLDRAIKIWKLTFHKDDFKGGAFDKVALENSIEKAHSSDITALKLSNHNSNILLSASASGEIKMWETLHGGLVKTFKSQKSWVFSIKIFEKEISFVKKVNSPASPKRKWRYLSPGKRVEKENSTKSVEIKDFYFMTASYDGNLKFWDSASDKPLFNKDSGNCHDCFPYGGVEIFNNEQLKTQVIFTSGNREDSFVNTWVLK